MDYYEELGLPREASEREIRRSYKRLAILFHPDQQLDPDVRALAETQMKRANEIAAVLTDPERRCLYDESLRAAELAPGQPPSTRWSRWVRNARDWVLMTAAAAIVLTVAALLPPDSPRPAVQRQEMTPQPVRSERGTGRARVPSGARSKVPRVPVMSNRLSLEEFGTGRPIAPKLDDPHPQEAADASEAAPAVEKPFPQFSVPPRQNSSPTPILLAGAETTPPEELTLAGKWVYAPDTFQLRDPKVFRADYIVLIISIAGDRLRGSYRSRYKTQERKINPVVSFTFEGPSNGTSFPWRNNFGASGEVTLRTRSRDVLDVSWFATAMGSTLSLGSGTATLFRF